MQSVPTKIQARKQKVKAAGKNDRDRHVGRHGVLGFSTEPAAY
jgi:hypothetical protein